MNRTIKFRGKRIDNGQWVYGDLVQCDHDILILPINTGWTHHKVIPETVGQFTGLLDKNGREIYEGDVLLFRSNKTPNKCEVGWNNAFTSFCVRLSYEERFGIKPLGEWLFVEPMEVISNIHDHPELLNSKNEQFKKN